MSFFNKKQKLEIIIYNKELQKEFGIDIDNYKKKMESIKQLEEILKELNIN